MIVGMMSSMYIWNKIFLIYTYCFYILYCSLNSLYCYIVIQSDIRFGFEKILTALGYTPFSDSTQGSKYGAYNTKNKYLYSKPLLLRLYELYYVSIKPSAT
jgi:hypothetical protein